MRFYRCLFIYVVHVFLFTDITSLLDCDMKLELDVTGIYCKVAEGGAPAAELSHKLHHWGTCFYLGLIIAKVMNFWKSVFMNSLSKAHIDPQAVHLFQLLRIFQKSFEPNKYICDLHLNILT